MPFNDSTKNEWVPKRYIVIRAEYMHLSIQHELSFSYLSLQRHLCSTNLSNAKRPEGIVVATLEGNCSRTSVSSRNGYVTWLTNDSGPPALEPPAPRRVCQCDKDPAFVAYCPVQPRDNVIHESPTNSATSFSALSMLRLPKLRYSSQPQTPSS